MRSFCISCHLTLAVPSIQDLPKYMKEKKRTAVIMMETQMAGLTQSSHSSSIFSIWSTSSTVATQLVVRHRTLSGDNTYNMIT